MSDDADGPPANARWLAGRPSSGRGSEPVAVHGTVLWVRRPYGYWLNVDLADLASIRWFLGRGGDVWTWVDRVGYGLRINGFQGRNPRVRAIVQPHLAAAAADPTVRIGWFARRRLREWGVTRPAAPGD